uniref:Candidate secreted effector n=1 Tax=Meloidogyne incognita TaxID=6306 RepID=A0A914NPQ7_MELIC
MFGQTFRTLIKITKKFKPKRRMTIVIYFSSSLNTEKNQFKNNIRSYGLHIISSILNKRKKIKNMGKNNI